MSVTFINPFMLTPVVVTPFVSDSFTDTSGLTLASHIGEIGATWTKHPSYTGVTAVSNANRLRFDSGPTAAYYTSAVPPTAEYQVKAHLYVASNTGFAAILGRCGISADTWYQAGYYDGSWRLDRAVAGSETILGTFAQALVVGATYEFRLEIKNASKKVFIDGVERISSTDNTLTATGRAGVRMITGTNTTGYHVDNFTATAL